MDNAGAIGELKVFAARCFIGLNAPRPAPRIIATLHVRTESPGCYYANIIFRRVSADAAGARGVRWPDVLPVKFICLPPVDGALFLDGKKPQEVLDQIISMMITLQARVIIERSETDRNVLVLTLQIKDFETQINCHLGELAGCFEIS